MYKIILILIIAMLSSIAYSINTLTSNIHAINNKHITILSGASHD